ncbi:MAG: response regulator transcription factor [Bacteroidota bacterium]|nr:response regulator transcription factor [Bacteroidota bacterium]
MNKELIRIMLVDDHKIVRKAWKSLLENNPRFQVIADCDNGQSAIEQARELIPDIMLVDINMSPLNGFTVTERVLETNPSIKIIGLSVNNQPKYAIKMVELGARGYLTKTSSLEEINHGILEVYKGEFYICEEVTRNMPASE